jgi:hypothetical protein
MLVDPGEVGLALDAQMVLRWRFFFADGFLAFRASVGKDRNIPSGETGRIVVLRGYETFSDLILRAADRPRLEGWLQRRCLRPSFETRASQRRNCAAERSSG